MKPLERPVLSAIILAAGLAVSGVVSTVQHFLK
jgi:hypothetical protein